MTQNPVLDAARRYRELGFSVIPFRPHGKSPDPEALAASGNFLRPGQPSWEVFNSRQATDEEFEAWFGSMERNLGLVTGFHDLFVLDFDEAETWNTWLSRYEGIARTTSIQRTGKGFHVMLRWHGAWTVPLYRNTRFRLSGVPGVIAGEMKGAFDNAVCWPSIHSSGKQYQWFPGQAPWETELVRIKSLREIGIQADRTLARTYLAALSKIITHPNSGVPILVDWVRRKYRFRRGIVFRNR
jgi:hypothetical protein